MFFFSNKGVFKSLLVWVSRAVRRLPGPVMIWVKVRFRLRHKKAFYLLLGKYLLKNHSIFTGFCGWENAT